MRLIESEVHSWSDTFRISLHEVSETFHAILFLIPRTSFLGAILVTGYLGGAVWAQLRIGDPWFFSIIIGVVMWIELGHFLPFS